MSGRAAEYFYRKQVGSNARILILDNHKLSVATQSETSFAPAAGCC
jgi:hypothetical protein